MSEVHSEQLLAQVAALPQLPGVYRYFDADGGVLYVGKARNLKKRVSSYFQKNHGGTRIGHMIGKIARHGDHGGALRGRGAAAREQPDQDAEPALQHPVPRRQELPLPEDHRRARQAGLRGDGGAPSAAVFPRVAYYRGAVDRKHRYFGPYPAPGR